MEFLQQTYLSNTLQQWLLSLAIIAGAFVLAKALYWIFGSFLRRFTESTEGGLDNILVDMIETPTVFVVVLWGIWLGATRLTMPDYTREWRSAC